MTTILQNVIGRNFIRTRLEDGVEAIPVIALEYFEAIRTQVNEQQDIIIEGLHTYGWGIGHPDVAVAERIYTAIDAVYVWTRGGYQVARDETDHPLFIAVRETDLED